VTQGHRMSLLLIPWEDEDRKSASVSPFIARLHSTWLHSVEPTFYLDVGYCSLCLIRQLRRISFILNREFSKIRFIHHRHGYDVHLRSEGHGCGFVRVSQSGTTDVRWPLEWHLTRPIGRREAPGRTRPTQQSLSGTVIFLLGCYRSS